MPSPLPNYRATAPFGEFLRLRLFGASHAPAIGMTLENFPQGFRLDFVALQAFLNRRAPGRDALSTTRKESDVPEFLSGLDGDRTTGAPITAVIHNTDCRPDDYAATSVIPRPGHADLPQWIQSGRIPSGGGMHSGRMTAPLCIAGGICLQWLERRGIRITARLISAGGNTASPETAIREAQRDGDSVGGVIEIQATGLPIGLGGPAFDGLESPFSAALFAIPGVKGVSFGDGFALADMRGSQANDPFAYQDGHVVTTTNHQGGLLGGMTTGMPLVIRIAFKPTPSIFLPQQSVNLATRENAVCAIRGRHDPCIARRALPVAEAVTAFVLADKILADEERRPRICLTLTGTTIEDDLQTVQRHYPFVDMCELRADFLAPEELAKAAEFPRRTGMPVILTLRRKKDGGLCTATPTARGRIFKQLLADAAVPFAYVDLESDFHPKAVEALAAQRGTQIIRSLHCFGELDKSLHSLARDLRGDTDEIPKIATAVKSLPELESFFWSGECCDDFPHIFCAMGEIGQASRILASRTHSMLTYASDQDAIAKLPHLGHLTPETLVHTYGFRMLNEDTALYAVTGWPLGHTQSPELNNAAFFAEGLNAVMVPLPSQDPYELLRFADSLDIQGIAVTVPHKQAMLSLMDELSPEAIATGAVNTVIRTDRGWHGANTDAVGFTKTLLEFLHCEDLTGRKVAILGAGGAATAVAYAVAQLHGDACIFNRTLPKAKALAKRYHFHSATLSPKTLKTLRAYTDIIIQCTSVGLSSNGTADQDPIPFYDFQGTEAVYDLIYSPAETHLMARARQAGCAVCNGMAMLSAQAKEQRRLYQALGNR